MFLIPGLPVMIFFTIIKEAISARKGNYAGQYAYARLDDLRAGDSQPRKN
jgi:hypothetical protein